MTETIAVFDAKQRLSELVARAAQGEDFVITRHGQPMARIGPVEAKPDREAAKRALLDHLATRPVVNVGRWTRAELYERGADKP